MEGAGADQDAAAGSAGDVVPAAFLRDPLAYLTEIAAKPPSPQSLGQLGGSVAKWFSGKSPEDDDAALEMTVAPMAAAYLQAAAVHLPETASQPASLNAQLEAVMTKNQYEIVTAVGVCATLCKSRRAAISSSGILPTLANLLLNNQTQTVNQLSLIGVEFLQCALLAEQYRYAARLVAGTWPRPDSTVNVKLVLRYYYLRGMIHIGCNDFVMARRCFWTCLSVPADVCCKIAVEAWKKLVLVQCIMNDGSDPDANKTSLPLSMPTCMGRLLSSSKEASTTGSAAASSGTSGTKRPQPSTGFGFFQQQAPAAASASTSRGGSSSNKKSQQTIDSESTACYMDIADAFYKRDMFKLDSLIAKHSLTLESDGNTGLVQQCHTQLIHNQVRHLSRMYSVVSVTKAASVLGIIANGSETATTSQQVAALLLQSGVTCEIQDDGMIVFHEDDATSSSPSLVDLHEWMSLLEKIQRLDVGIMTSPRYLSLMRKEAASGDSKPAAPGAGGPRGVDEV